MKTALLKTDIIQAAKEMGIITKNTRSIIAVPHQKISTITAHPRISITAAQRISITAHLLQKISIIAALLLLRIRTDITHLLNTLLLPLHLSTRLVLVRDAYWVKGTIRRNSGARISRLTQGPLMSSCKYFMKFNS